MTKAQLDMFAPAEAALFPPQPVVAYPDEGRVRGRLARMLDGLRSDDGPLDHERRRYPKRLCRG